jgi:excisionase family DNA binding protein
MSEHLRTVRQAAEDLCLKERTVRRWVFLRKITFVKIGAAVRIPKKEIDRITRRGTISRLSVEGRRNDQ